MSYIRMGHPLVHVEGKSEDYVYSTGERIEDYGSISDSGFIEMLFEWWKTNDKEFKEHLLKRLAERLGVKLRPKPLTDEELMKLEEENLKEFKEENKMNKENEDLLKSLRIGINQLMNGEGLTKEEVFDMLKDKNYTWNWADEFKKVIEKYKHDYGKTIETAYKYDLGIVLELVFKRFIEKVKEDVSKSSVIEVGEINKINEIIDKRSGKLV